MEPGQKTSWMTISQLTDTLQDICRINSTWDDIFNKDDAMMKMGLELTNTASGPIVRLVILG